MDVIRYLGGFHLPLKSFLFGLAPQEKLKLIKCHLILEDLLLLLPGVGRL